MSSSSRPLPLFLAGLLLLLLGAAWASVETQGYLPRLALACGLLILGIFLVRHAAEIRFLLLRMHTHSEPGPTTTLLLAALVLGLGGLLAGRTTPLIDLTARRVNSLSLATRTSLAALHDDVRLDGFFINPSPQYDQARRHLDLYERTCRRIRTSLVDPDRQPERAREASVTRAGVIVVSCRDARTQVHELSEEAITQGVLRVLEGRPRRVGFLQGHGEPALDTGGEKGITAWVQALGEANIEGKEINLLQAGAVPPSLDALVIMHPRHRLYDSEIKPIREFLERGGGVGLWLEPGDSTGLESFLEFHYLRLLPGTIRDDGPVTRRLGLGPWTPALAANPAHPIGAEMSGTYIAAPEVRPLEIVSPHPPDLFIYPILKSAHTALVLPGPGEDEPSPSKRGIQVAGAVLEWDLPVGVTWGTQLDSLGLPPVKPKARILVIGDASMVTNRYMGIGANALLAVNAVHWLTWQERFLDIQPRFHRSSGLRVGASGLRVLLYIVQIGLPLAFAMLGLGVWLWRRSRS